MELSPAFYLFIFLPLFAAPATAVYRYMGCFQEPAGTHGILQQQPATTFQSVGLCKNRCGSADWPVAALTNGTECFCATTMPPFSQQAYGGGSCDSPCPGYPREYCGGKGFYSVYLDQQYESREDRVPGQPGQPTAEPVATRVAISDARTFGALPHGGSGL